MSDYISREAAIELLHYNADERCSAVVSDFEEIPAADVEPVRYGRWVDYMVRDWRCSECGQKIIKVRNVDWYCYNDKPNYCPNCGAKMGGGAG